MRIIIISTDTLHHRYFINQIHKDFPLQAVFLENTGLNKRNMFFKKLSGRMEWNKKLASAFFSPYWQLPLWESREKLFEEKMFFKSVPKELPTDFEVTRVADINLTASIDLLRKRCPDLIILFGTRKVSKELIKIPKKYIFNIHRGIVPKYRGLDSDLWAIYLDDFSNIGVTIHLVNGDLDTGGIIYQRRLQITPQMSLYHLRYYTTLMATEMVLQALRDIQLDRLIVRQQETTGNCFSYMPFFLKFRVIYKFLRYRNRLQKRFV